MKSTLRELIRSNLAHLGQDKDLEQPVKISLKAVSKDIWSKVDQIPLVTVDIVSTSLTLILDL